MALANFKIAFGARGAQYTKEDKDIVLSTMEGRGGLTQGRWQERFEESFCSHFSLDSAFATSSCTGALELAAILCQLKPEDEVIAPAHTFAATALPFARTGATIRWADIDPDTWVMSADSVAELITKKTKVLVVVHLYGVPADMDALLELARANDIIVIEDCAQALGATFKGKPAGGFGEASCFSFHSHKILTTLGEGGLLAVNRPAWKGLVAGLRHNGMRGFDGNRDRYWLPAMTNVDFDIEGQWPYKFCLGETQCALGFSLLQRLAKTIRRREELARRIRAAFSTTDFFTFQSLPDDRTSAFYALPIRVADKHRDKVITRMAEDFGVQCVTQYYPLYRYPIFVKAGFGEAMCPHTESFYDNMLSIPFYEGLTDEEVDQMIGGLTACANNEGSRS
ncbi:MAG: hypothetical protein CL483_03040 [Acidobacteria bacterium]|nr:hypothetical protein [Acidobacteriota bacterium]|tara:strand:- start:359 stop:1546 length:1188 start_codon:yes stop_codon:yes gene_type:complete